MAAALRALLQAARAQLDRQVEVRMRQAASRASTGGRVASAGGSGAHRAVYEASPAERRGRLDFRE